MSKITAKMLNSMANGVATAKKYGIETDSTRNTPIILPKAEAILAKMKKKVDSANEYDCGSYSEVRNYERYIAYKKAVEALKSAMKI